MSIVFHFRRPKQSPVLHWEEEKESLLIEGIVTQGSTDGRCVFLFHVRDGVLKRKSQSIEIVATFEHRWSTMSIVKHGDVFQDHVNQFDLPSVDQTTDTDS